MKLVDAANHMRVRLKPPYQDLDGTYFENFILSYCRVTGWHSSGGRVSVYCGPDGTHAYMYRGVLTSKRFMDVHDVRVSWLELLWARFAFYRLTLGKVVPNRHIFCKQTAWKHDKLTGGKNAFNRSQNTSLNEFEISRSADDIFPKFVVPDGLHYEWKLDPEWHEKNGWVRVGQEYHGMHLMSCTGEHASEAFWGAYKNNQANLEACGLLK